MGSTLITPIADLTIANAATQSSSISHEQYADADGILFYCPSGQTSWAVEASNDGTNWYQVITGTTPLLVTTALAVAIPISPPAALFYRVVAGASVGTRTIKVSKVWGMRHHGW